MANQQTRSIEPSQTKWLKAQIQRIMCLRFAPQDLTGFREECERMLSQVGQKRFSDAITRCLRERVEFPSPVELEAMIPTPCVESDILARMEVWKRDKALHPENYCTDEETAQLLRDIQEKLSQKHPSHRGNSAEIA